LNRFFDSFLDLVGFSFRPPSTIDGGQNSGPSEQEEQL